MQLVDRVITKIQGAMYRKEESGWELMVLVIREYPKYSGKQGVVSGVGMLCVARNAFGLGKGVDS
jgi:hypothetical protein